jgi:hypothetical protein
MGAAFEVNRQVCDIEIARERWDKIGKEWDSKKQEIVYSIFNENDMEKKKMTKAEAFEWLKCKKVHVSCREINEKVQSKLFACGVQWKNGGTDFCDYGNYYVINSHGLLGHCDGMGPYWECLINEEISADDILSIEIVEGTPEFSFKKVVELAKPLMEYLNDTGCTDQIGVSYDHIVAQPMATFLHGEMKGC